LRDSEQLESFEEFGNATRPPKLGGQRDRDAVEITREEVPTPHFGAFDRGTSPRATLRAALPS